MAGNERIFDTFLNVLIFVKRSFLSLYIFPLTFITTLFLYQFPDSFVYLFNRGRWGIPRNRLGRSLHHAMD